MDWRDTCIFCAIFELELSIFKSLEKPNDDHFAFFIGEFSRLDIMCHRWTNRICQNVCRNVKRRIFMQTVLIFLQFLANFLVNVRFFVYMIYITRIHRFWAFNQCIILI